MLKSKIIAYLPGRIKTTYIDEVVFIKLIEYVACYPVLLTFFKVFVFKFIVTLAGIGDSGRTSSRDERPSHACKPWASPKTAGCKRGIGKASGLCALY